MFMLWHTDHQILDVKPGQGFDLLPGAGGRRKKEKVESRNPGKAMKMRALVIRRWNWFGRRIQGAEMQNTGGVTLLLFANILTLRG